MRLKSKNHKFIKSWLLVSQSSQGRDKTTEPHINGSHLPQADASSRWASGLGVRCLAGGMDNLRSLFCWLLPGLSDMPAWGRHWSQVPGAAVHPDDVWGLDPGVDQLESRQVQHEPIKGSQQVHRGGFLEESGQRHGLGEAGVAQEEMHQHLLAQAVPEVQHQVLQPLQQEPLVPGLQGPLQQQGEQGRLQHVGGEHPAPLRAEGLLQALPAEVPQALEDLQALEVAGGGRGLLLQPAQQPLLLPRGVEAPEGLGGRGGQRVLGRQGREVERVADGDGGDEAHGHGDVAADVVGAGHDVQHGRAPGADREADAAALLQPVPHGAQAALQVALEPAQHQRRGEVAAALQLHAEALCEGPVAARPAAPRPQAAHEGAVRPQPLGAARLRLQVGRQAQGHQDVEAVGAAHLVLLVGAADAHEVPAQAEGERAGLQPLHLGGAHQLGHDAPDVRLAVPQHVGRDPQLPRVEPL